MTTKFDDFQSTENAPTVQAPSQVCFNFLSLRRYIITTFNPRSFMSKSIQPARYKYNACLNLTLVTSSVTTRVRKHSSQSLLSRVRQTRHNKPLTTIDWPFHPSAAMAPKSGSGLSQTQHSTLVQIQRTIIIVIRQVASRLYSLNCTSSNNSKNIDAPIRRLYISSSKSSVFTSFFHRFSSCYLRVVQPALRIDV